MAIDGSPNCRKKMVREKDEILVMMFQMAFSFGAFKMMLFKDQAYYNASETLNSFQDNNILIWSNLEPDAYNTLTLYHTTKF